MVRLLPNAENARLDASYPPTAYRIDFLRSHPCDKAQITISDSRMTAIDKELEQLHGELGGRLIALYARD
ncbi:MAG: hypothetical protein HC850_08310 [Rhodomicrobium sp.]|nr:hypothetical protein [Rhodomicrobium sp.]